MFAELDEFRPSPARPPQLDEGGSVIRVLIVDDEPAVLWKAEQTLRQAGYATATALDGAGAVRVVERVGLVGLLMTELYMPMMNGIQLSLRLRQRQPDLKALYLIPRGDRLLPRQISLSPNEQFLEMPFTPDTLLDAVCTLLHRDRRRGGSDEVSHSDWSTR